MIRINTRTLQKKNQQRIECMDVLNVGNISYTKSIELRLSTKKCFKLEKISRHFCL